MDIWIICVFVYPSIKQNHFNHLSAHSYGACARTSFIVLAVRTDCFHSYVTPGTSPSGLADAVPATGLQSTSSVVVAETWTTLWAHGTNTQLEKLGQCEWVAWGHGWPSGCERGFNQYTFLKVGDDSFVFELWKMRIIDIYIFNYLW